MKKIFTHTPLDETINLSKDTTHHILHVFRHDIRKSIIVTGTDNRTGEYKITGENNGEATAELIRYIATNSKQSRTVLVQSYLKGDKLEWVLQKATELNVDTIYLVSTDNCIAKYDAKKIEAKYDRWIKILTEASQQCGRSSLPSLVINESLPSIFDIEHDALTLVAYENENGTTLKDSLSKRNENQDILICIGPEGGFNKAEINDIIECGGIAVSLGTNILRAETAAIGALAMMHYELEL